jgi:hypothetical protein
MCHVYCWATGASGIDNGGVDDDDVLVSAEADGKHSPLRNQDYFDRHSFPVQLDILTIQHSLLHPTDPFTVSYPS